VLPLPVPWDPSRLPHGQIEVGVPSPHSDDLVLRCIQTSLHLYHASFLLPRNYGWNHVRLLELRYDSLLDSPLRNQLQPLKEHEEVSHDPPLP